MTEHHHHSYQDRSSGVERSASAAALLEILPGLFIQTFGIGHIYAGRVGLGIAIMLSYWVLAVINFALCFVLIGLVTWPLTFLVYVIVSPIAAARACDRSGRLA